MLVERIIQFIKSIKNTNKLADYDKTLYEKLESHFQNQSPIKVLDSNDITFILECFSTRSKNVFLSDFDYTLHPDTLNPLAANPKWIQLAKELAPIAGKSYIAILMPNMINIIDYNSLSFLADTPKTENFLIAHGNKILFTKRGLCLHLISKDYILSTVRDLHINKLHPLAVDELTRLRKCKEPDGHFQIDNEHFNNFWDFLNKKAFPRLQSKGSLQKEICNNLLVLIEQYKTLKKTKQDFISFKLAAIEFCNSLQNHQLNNVNFFYGALVKHKDSYRLMLDYLVDIYSANTFNIDEQVKELEGWLETLQEVNQSAPKSPKGVLQNSTPQAPRSPQGMYLLVALMTTNFNVPPASETHISFMNIPNKVTPELAKLYSKLITYVKDNKLDQLEMTYQQIRKSMVLPTKNTSFFTNGTVCKSNIDWFTHVKLETLSSIGILLVQPEVLMSSLMEFRLGHSHTANQINSFLDGLINTYHQELNQPVKTLHINISFNLMLNTFSQQDRDKLVTHIGRYNITNAKNHFAKNVNSYIYNRMLEVAKVPLNQILDTTNTEIFKELLALGSTFENKKMVTAFTNNAPLQTMTDYVKSLKQKIPTDGLIVVKTSEPML